MSMIHKRGALIVAAALLALVPTAGAAEAAPGTPDVPFTIGMPGGLTMVPGSDRSVRPLVNGFGGIENPTATYAFGDLPAGVTFQIQPPLLYPYACTQTATEATCRFQADWFIDPHVYTTALPTFTLIVDAGAHLGATGSMHVTLTGTGPFPVTTAQTKVTVGEGADLTALGGGSRDVGPGGSLPIAAAVRNSGSVPVHGVVLEFREYAGGGVAAMTKRYRNCLYGDGVNLVVCTFDMDLAPATSYQFSPAIEVQVAGDVIAPSHDAVSLDWWTPQDWQDWLAGVGTDAGPQPHTPGTDAPLNLEPVAANTAAGNPPQTDTNIRDNSASYPVNINGTNLADLAVLGATASGAIGATVPVKVGVHNNGPATARNDAFLESVWPMVEFPAGVTVVSMPDGWSNSYDNKYSFVATTPLKAGETVWFTFGVRIDRAPTGQGTILLYAGRVHPWDTNPANDTAPIVVTVASPAPTASPGGGAGGGLPVTGAPLGPLAVVGAVMLAAGLGLWLLARRPRTP